jgi:hypothetical protein
MTYLSVYIINKCEEYNYLFFFFYELFCLQPLFSWVSQMFFSFDQKKEKNK